MMKTNELKQSIHIYKMRISQYYFAFLLDNIDFALKNQLC